MLGNFHLIPPDQSHNTHEEERKLSSSDVGRILSRRCKGNMPDIESVLLLADMSAEE